MGEWEMEGRNSEAELIFIALVQHEIGNEKEEILRSWRYGETQSSVFSRHQTREINDATDRTTGSGPSSHLSTQGVTAPFRKGRLHT